jgi:hypothetical protein
MVVEGYTIDNGRQHEIPKYTNHDVPRPVFLTEANYGGTWACSFGKFFLPRTSVVRFGALLGNFFSQCSQMTFVYEYVSKQNHLI